jgi:hypothetical protein
MLQPAGDAHAIEQLNSSLNTQLELGRTSIPLLAAFGLNPSTGKTYDFSATYFAEFMATDRVSNPGGLVANPGSLIVKDSPELNPA